MKKKLSYWIHKLDTAISNYVRSKAKFTCERCKKAYNPNVKYGLSGLHCSHYMGRTNKSTRFELENLDCFCNGCHSYFEDRKQTAYRDWKIEKHGLHTVERLEWDSRQTRKWKDYELIDLIKKYKDEVKGC